MNVKLGTIEASLASCEKVIATWLRYEKYVFGTQFPQSHNSLFTLLCELCKCNHTYVCALQVFDRAARVTARICTPLDSLKLLETTTLTYVLYNTLITVSRFISKASTV